MTKSSSLFTIKSKPFYHKNIQRLETLPKPVVYKLELTMFWSDCDAELMSSFVFSSKVLHSFSILTDAIIRQHLMFIYSFREMLIVRSMILFEFLLICCQPTRCTINQVLFVRTYIPSERVENLHPIVIGQLGHFASWRDTSRFACSL